MTKKRTKSTDVYTADNRDMLRPRLVMENEQRKQPEAPTIQTEAQYALLTPQEATAYPTPPNPISPNYSPPFPPTPSKHC